MIETVCELTLGVLVAIGALVGAGIIAMCTLGAIVGLVKYGMERHGEQE
jgi:hypothetical protein